MDRKHMISKGKGFKTGRKTSKSNDQYKKFIGNRFEGQGFADKRKKKIQYEYMKMLKKEKLKERLQQEISKHEGGKGTSSASKHSKTLDVVKKEKKHEEPSESLTQPRTSSIDTERSHLKPELRKKIYDGNKTEGSNLKSDLNAERHPKMFRQSIKKGKGDKKGKEVTSRFSKAAQEHKEKKEKKMQKLLAYNEDKKRREEALGAYQKRKQETFKKICKKTHKGQPVMKNQIEYLLQKIEKQVNQR